MKLEAVLANYAPFSRVETGKFEIVLSPDGWEGSRYESVSNCHLTPGELVEFNDLVTSFLHTCKDQKELRKFCKKYGTDTDAVTYSFRFECVLMTYIVHVTGYSVLIFVYRKDDA